MSLNNLQVWRHGPKTPDANYDTLCNSCGVKWKRGRILCEFKRTTTTQSTKKKIPFDDSLMGPTPVEGDFKSITRSTSGSYCPQNDYPLIDNPTKVSHIILLFLKHDTNRRIKNTLKNNRINASQTTLTMKSLAHPTNNPK